MSNLKRAYFDTLALFRAIPSLFFTSLVLSVVLMNLLANKELVNMRFLALDCGTLLSWISFLCMDVICKHFGTKAAYKVAVVTVLFNLISCGFFALAAVMPGNWGEFYTTQNPQTNAALNATFGGSWYVLFGSTVAMSVAFFTNAFLNGQIGKRLLRDDFASFATRSLVSTALAQFLDNLLFALLVSYRLFGWELSQVFVCALTTMAFELACAALFTPFGYAIVKSWRRNGVGVF